ncbi:hypothetical protein B4135_2236 [Caldibacillus debilis]|uniref:Uncharacterized protein n=1 Tax=Caldibacillus debilis TaxID=301148 RepID=A0A150M262_9BACI|nr:hypothetical protein B4135_2236 [Caldibacillus debilis]
MLRVSIYGKRKKIPFKAAAWMAGIGLGPLCQGLRLFHYHLETGGGKNKWKSPAFSILSMLSGKG